MRAALLILAVVLGGCQREPDFSERYDAASKKIGTAARQMDVELDKRAKEMGDKAEIKEGRVLLQADAGLPYETLKKVMYTASMAGYPQLKMVTTVGN